MKQKFTIVFFLLFLIFYTKGALAQSNSPDWEIGIHGGSTLFWGDLSDAENDGEYLKKFRDDIGWSLGTNIEYRILPFAFLGGDFTYGKLQGIRDKYEAGNKLNQIFQGEYFDYSLTFRLNINDLIDPDKGRNATFYLLGGLGHIHYRAVTNQLESGDYINSVGYSNQGRKKESMKSDMRIPFGAGVKFYMTKRLNATLNTTVNWVNTDNLDATTGSTNINDYYTYTSIGLNYKFGKEQEAKPEPEPEPKPEPEPAIAREPVDVNLSIDFPATIYQDSSVQVEYQIDKQDLTSEATFEQNLPEGVEATSGKASGATFKFEEQKLIFEWEDMPKADIITMEVNFQTKDIAEDTYETDGEFVYNENDESKEKTFGKSFQIIPKPKPEPAVAQEEEKQEEPARDKIVYRVQVRAIYNGKQSAKKVQSVYDLDDDVYEHFHKGYAKYSAGDFDSYSEAREYRQYLRNEKGIDGAFVVAFHDDERLDDLADVDKIKDQPQKDKPEKEEERYKVQVAAVSSDRDRIAIAVISDKFNLDGESIAVETSDGWHRYTIGEYSSYPQAKNKLEQIRKKVPGAFIAKYIGGKRVDISASD